MSTSVRDCIPLTVDDGEVTAYVGEEDVVVLQVKVAGEVSDFWLTPDEAARLSQQLATALSELPSHALLTPAEVAALFHVDAKTVTRWANAGRLPSLRTLGGHRRFREAEVRALLQRPA